MEKLISVPKRIPSVELLKKADVDEVIVLLTTPITTLHLKGKGKANDRIPIVIIVHITTATMDTTIPLIQAKERGKGGAVILIVHPLTHLRHIHLRHIHPHHIPGKYMKA